MMPPRKLKPEIGKPYKVPLMIDSKPLVTRSGERASAYILDPDKPPYSGDVIYQLNPFWVTLFGGGEFQVMKLARHEWPNAQVLEIITP